MLDGSGFRLNHLRLPPEQLAQEFIATLGCELLTVIKRRQDRQVLRVRNADGRICCLKIFPLSDKTCDGVFVHKHVLPKLQGPFRRLVVPETISCGEVPYLGNYILTDWVSGQSYNDRWNEKIPETAGGRAIPLDSTLAVVDMIGDLGRIHSDTLPDKGMRVLGENQIQHISSVCLKKAIQSGLVSDRQKRRARRVFKEFRESCVGQPLSLSNGDFQFRNFIELGDGTTALIDWDAARLSPFEKEHCVSYQWMLMWNNPRWQARFLLQAKAQLDLDRTRFRGALLLNTLKQATMTWSGAKAADLSQRQLDYAISVLDDSAFDYIWDPATEIISETPRPGLLRRLWGGGALAGPRRPAG